MKLRASLRINILVGCFIAILGSAMFAYIEFSRVAGRFALQAVRGRADALASGTATAIAPDVVSGNAAGVRKIASRLAPEIDLERIRYRMAKAIIY